MSHENVTNRRYLSGDYADKNPSWDLEDAPWKARQVLEIVRAHKLFPASIAEVGCGAGGVLAKLRSVFPETDLFGFDIAPTAQRHWAQFAQANIQFRVGDLFSLSQRRYELMLVLDVVEHVPDPFEFLARLRGHADYFIFHFPLDLSAISVLRESPLLYAREKVGHIHYYTKGLVLATLTECGYDIVDWRYTGATFTAPQLTWKTRLASPLRRAAYALNKDMGVRLLGGETLMLLARVKENRGIVSDDVNSAVSLNRVCE